MESLDPPSLEVLDNSLLVPPLPAGPHLPEARQKGGARDSEDMLIWGISGARYVPVLYPRVMACYDPGEKGVLSCLPTRRRGQDLRNN